MSRVKKTIQEESEKTMSLFDQLRDTEVFKELDILYKTGIDHVDATEISGSIVGKSAINRAIKDMVNKAKSTVIISTTEHGWRKQIAHLKVILQALNKRGVSVKVIAPISEAIAKKHNVKSLKGIDLNSRFVIADDELLFHITDESATPDYETVVWVKSDVFAGSLATLLQKL